MYWAIGLFTAFLTSFYMFRLWFLTFFGEYRGAAENSATISPRCDAYRRDCATRAWARGIHESPRVMVIPLVVLAVLSVIGGWIGVPVRLAAAITSKSSWRRYFTRRIAERAEC